jgi:hypothetical protein
MTTVTLTVSVIIASEMPVELLLSHGLPCNARSSDLPLLPSRFSPLPLPPQLAVWRCCSVGIAKKFASARGGVKENFLLFFWEL